MLHLLVAVLDPGADATAVGVVRALRAAMPSLDVSRLGGTALAHEGTRDIAASGSLSAGLQRTPVDAALLVGGGRLGQARLGRRLRRHDVTVAVLAGEHGVAWPWTSSRLAAACDVVIATPVDDVQDLLTAGAVVQRVGHPLADDVTLPLAQDRASARRALGLGEDQPVVAVCGGSADADLREMAPVLRDAMRQWQGRGEGIQLAVATPDEARAAAVRRRLGGGPGTVVVHAGPARAVVTAADVAVCGDGETTLLSALLGTPLLLARRRAWRERASRAVAARMGGRVPSFHAWPNRVLGDLVVPELLDDECRGPRVASEVSGLVEHAADQARRLAEVRTAVRADRAWAAIARLLVDLAVGRAAATGDQPPTVKRSS